jgi:LmbE family N-acetylglucosaminyl deacetylase
MTEQLRLMAIVAHPDDESLGLGGALARYAAEGVETVLVTATRGERGRFFTNEDRPSDEKVGAVREAELRAAARELGVRRVELLGYIDGELDRAEPREAIGRIVRHIREARPQVVVTFDPFGAYGHPDHVAVSQLAAGAVVAAADPEFTDRDDHGPHAVSKLYYLVEDSASWKLYQRVFKRLVSTVDGVERVAMPWPDWSITTRIDARAHWETVWRAVRRHETQLAIYRGLDDLHRDELVELWGSKTFYRAFSTVNGGRQPETDLFAGLR